jgi:hypothetical protein
MGDPGGNAPRGAGGLAARHDFTTPADAANSYAATLIGAALHGTRLPHY